MVMIPRKIESGMDTTNDRRQRMVLYMKEGWMARIGSIIVRGSIMNETRNTEIGTYERRMAVIGPDMNEEMDGRDRSHF